MKHYKVRVRIKNFNMKRGSARDAKDFLSPNYELFFINFSRMFSDRNISGYISGISTVVQKREFPAIFSFSKKKIFCNA